MLAVVAAPVRWSKAHRWPVTVVIVLALAAAVLAVTTRRSADFRTGAEEVKSGAAPADATAADNTASSTPDSAARRVSAAYRRPAPASGVVKPGGSLPLGVTAPDTSHLKDGQAITFHVAANPGSQVFGLEARLCAGGAPIALDADIRPTVSGKCVSKPLSPDSDVYREAAAAAPYQAVDLAFRVGTGTDSYVTQYGDPVSITCGPGHPCELALKLQVPGGFGFRTYPLTFTR